MRKSSMVMTAMIATGLFASVGGTGLAVSGLASDTTAVRAQYPGQQGGGGPSINQVASGQPAAGAAPSSAPGATPAPAPAPGATPGSTPGADDGSVGGDRSRSKDGSAGDTAASTPSAEQVGRETTVLADRGGLPFTGMAAVPLLIAGLAMLGAGLVLRRRTTPQPGF